MPGHCCVPGCRGNYDGEKAVRVFTFPADADRRRQWLKAIPRADFVPGKRSVVCERYSRASDIRTSSSYVDSKTGKVVEAILKIARLSPDAVPCVFPNCPAYLSAPATATSRKAPDEKRMRLEAASLREAIAASLQTHEEEESGKNIDNFPTLLERVSEIKLSSFWNVISRPTCVAFFSLASVDAPSIFLSITISQDLTVKVYCRDVQLTTSDGIHTIPVKINDMRLLTRLLDDVEALDQKILPKEEERIKHLPQRSFLTGGIGTPEAPAVTNEPTRGSADTSDSSLERLLPAAFRAALEMYPVVPAADVKIVVIIAYYRSGSSFVGELLSSAPRTFFHFEPLMPFTVSGSIRPGRQRHAFHLLDELVRCRFEPLYTVWLENNPYYKYNHFLADVCEGGESCSSPGHLSALCSRAETQTFKFTRLRVSQVESWIQRNPDIAQSVRVVHLVRDPRAIYSSRRGLRWCTDYKPCDSAAALCSQMRSDLDAFEELTRRLQINRTYQIRFEDLAADPLNETMRLFGRLGLNFCAIDFEIH
ncbi:hypothetical protein HPB49_009507 [Dermacentor silvarum]|uniref:Uncharacterized protein n=1 Tax=Dermacentor silvarum TaxID=543639 RepID=A0ACB8DCG7_DERSI|nr:hypothetical protein HPB49_009507 [Dermacentor silvarum]